MGQVTESILFVSSVDDPSSETMNFQVKIMTSSVVTIASYSLPAVELGPIYTRICGFMGYSFKWRLSY